MRNTRDCIVESQQVISAKIAESFDRVISVIEEKKRSEVQRFQSEADRKVQHLESDEMTVKDILSEVSAVQSLVERGLKMLSDIDFMTRKKGMIFKINEMHSCIDNILKVQHESDVNVQVIGSGSVEEAGLLCDRYLQPYKVVDPLQCTATANAGDACVQVGEAAIASIVLRDSEGTACCFQLQCITVELHSTRFGERVSAKVVLQSASCYEALYTPSLRTSSQVVSRSQTMAACSVDQPLGSAFLTSTTQAGPQYLAEFFQKIEESRSGGHVKWQSIMSLSYIC